jgi:hypothetical protein
VTVLLDVVFAFTEGVPELDGAVSGTRHNLPVVSTEADREHIGGVANESASGGSSVKIPEPEGVVPG